MLTLKEEDFVIYLVTKIEFLLYFTNLVYANSKVV